MHDAGVAEHGVDFLLGDGDEADEEDITDEENDEKVLDPFGAVAEREHGDGDAEETVEAEFLEDPGVQHGDGGWGGGVCRSGP